MFNNALGVTRHRSILAFQSHIRQTPERRHSSIPSQPQSIRPSRIVEQVLRHAVICHQMRPVRGLNTSEDEIRRGSCRLSDDGGKSGPVRDSPFQADLPKPSGLASDVVLTSITISRQRSMKSGRHLQANVVDLQNGMFDGMPAGRTVRGLWRCRGKRRPCSSLAPFHRQTGFQRLMPADRHACFPPSCAGQSVRHNNVLSVEPLRLHGDRAVRCCPMRMDGVGLRSMRFGSRYAA